MTTPPPRPDHDLAEDRGGVTIEAAITGSIVLALAILTVRWRLATRPRPM